MSAPSPSVPSEFGAAFKDATKQHVNAAEVKSDAAHSLPPSLPTPTTASDPSPLAEPEDANNPKVDETTDPALPPSLPTSTTASDPSPLAEPEDANSPKVDEKMLAVEKRFYELLDANANKKKRKVELITDAQYDMILKGLNGWKARERHTTEESKWNKNYIIMAGAPRSSALRRKGHNLKVVTKEQMFAIIMDTHKKLAHARDVRKIYNDIRQKWYGITQDDVKLALGLCPICFASRVKIKAKQAPLRMILSVTIGKRAQMDLIDMTSQQDPDGYCYILRLIDHASGFGSVKPLKTKSSKECAIAIIQILSTHPDFDILQSDNGGEFLGETVKYVNK